MFLATYSSQIVPSCSAIERGWREVLGQGPPTQRPEEGSKRAPWAWHSSSPRELKRRPSPTSTGWARWGQTFTQARTVPSGARLANPSKASGPKGQRVGGRGNRREPPGG